MTDKSKGDIKRFAGNALSCVATRVLQVSLLVWVNQYLIKRIAPEEYSLLPLVMSLLVFAELFNAAFISGVGRFLVAADARGDKKEVTRIVSSIMPFLAAVTLVFLLAGGLTIYFIEDVLDISPAYQATARWMTAILLLPVALNLLATPFGTGPYVKQKFVLLNAIDLGGEVVRIGIVVVLLLAVSTEVLWLVVGSGVAQLLNLGLRIAYTRKMMPEVRFQRSLISKSRVKEMTGFGAWSSVGSFASLATNTIPILMLGHYATAIEVAVFYLGRLPDVNIRKMALAAMRPMQPILTSMFAIDGMSSLKTLFYRGGRYHMWVTLLIVPPLVVFSERLVFLYAGNDYMGAAWVMVALLLQYPVIWASAMYYRIAHASGVVSSFFKFELINVVLTIVAVFTSVLVFRWGAVGTAMAISGTIILVHLCLIWPKSFHQVQGRWGRFFKQTVIPGSLPAVAASVACYLFMKTVGLETWWHLAAGGLLGLIVYVLTLFFFCIDEVDQDLVDRFKSKLTRRKVQSVKSQ